MPCKNIGTTYNVIYAVKEFPRGPWTFDDLLDGGIKYDN